MSSKPQHSLRAFRRFEPDIAIVLSRYPNTTLFDPYPMSHVTYAARFRDALKSMELNNWTSTKFTLDDVRRVFAVFKAGGDFVVTSTSDEKILIGPRTTPDLLTPMLSGSAASTTDQKIVAPSDEIFNAFLVLKMHSLLRDRLVFQNLNEQQREILESHPILAVVEDPPGTLVVL